MDHEHSSMRNDHLPPSLNTTYHFHAFARIFQDEPLSLSFFLLQVWPLLLRVIATLITNTSCPWPLVTGVPGFSMDHSDTPSQEQPRRETLLRSLTSIEQLNTCSLILSAAGISHRINFIAPNHIELFVSLTDLSEAREELDSFERENRNWPPSGVQDDYAPVFRAMTPIVIAALIYIYSLSGDWSPQSMLFTAGAGDSEAILKTGEMYRLITALTLHADSVHLLGNCLLGGFLLHFLLLTTGNGIGLATVLTGSFAANFINVYLRGPGHHFVGFSTAVFVVIGMLCVIGFAGKKQKVLPLLMPVMAGLALLALLGSSGERTDFGAHLFGLLCGLVTGNIVKLPQFNRLRSSLSLQVSLSILSFLVVWLSWRLAFYSL